MKDTPNESLNGNASGNVNVNANANVVICDSHNCREGSLEGLRMMRISCAARIYPSHSWADPSVASPKPDTPPPADYARGVSSEFSSLDYRQITWITMMLLLLTGDERGGM